MIRAYKKKPIEIDYQKLFFATVKDKYFNLALGMIVALIISTSAYRVFLKNVKLNLAWSWPKFNFNSKTQEVTKVKPQPIKTYIVQEGDDLWNIAEKFYGSGFNAYDIAVANKLPEASVLVAGQKIIIPHITPRQLTKGEISAIATGEVTNVNNRYVVQPGDSLSIIAQKVYGDLYAWPTILQANSLISADQIEVGMILIIPR